MIGGRATKLRATVAWALCAVLALAVVACTDPLPTAPSDESGALVAAPGCGWMQWTRDAIDVEEWFALNPEVSALHWWFSASSEFRSVRAEAAQFGAFRSLRPGMLVWREHSQGAPAVSFRARDTINLIRLERGTNLVPWTGGKRITATLRETLRWVGPGLIGVTRWDAGTRTCHRDVDPPLQWDLDVELGPGDLLALELKQEAGWTLSWVVPAVLVTVGDVGHAAYAELRQQMRLFVGYMAAEHDLVASPYSVLLQADLEAVTRAFRALGGAELDMSWWPTDACGVAWIAGIGLLADCDDPIAFDHEYVHVLQTQIAGGDFAAAWTIEPQWLVEGMASYIAAHYRAAMEYETYFDARQNAVDQARSGSAVLPLEDLEAYPEWREADPPQAYATGFLAAEWLAAWAGDEALWAYMRQLQRAGTRWSFAFDVAFTLTVEDFYAAFARHAESFDPPQPHVIKGRLIDPSGLAAAGLRLYASPPDGGVSRYAQTDANGRFGIAAPAGTYGLSVHSESGCTAYGDYREGESLGAWSNATHIEVGPRATPDVLVRLPAAPSRLRGRSTCDQPQEVGWLRGRMVDSQGRPVVGAEVRACAVDLLGGCGRALTDVDGRYALDAPPGEVVIHVSPADHHCVWWGARGAHGKVGSLADAVPVTIGLTPSRGINIRLPVPVEQLDPVNSCW